MSTMQVVQPRIRGFICVSAHPAGCAANTQEQIAYIKDQKPLRGGPKNVLVIGASTGYGLASRIAAAYGARAATLGVFYEKKCENARPASAGWYNSAAFETQAKADGLWAKSINGDAFSKEIKDATIALIKKEMSKIDLVVYSLAAPRRTDPATGQVHKSVIKPIGQKFTSKTLNTDKHLIEEVTLEPATDEEVEGTVKVMGGEDWELWMEALEEAGLLAEGCNSVAYSYIGPEVTWPVYKNGTIGRAKEDLEAAASRIDALLKLHRGRAFVSVNKAVVTQSSSAIPVVPLYIALLFKSMKAHGLHEGCIQQVWRLFATQMYNGNFLAYDDDSRVRLDDWEMRDEIQREVFSTWPQITTENLYALTDYKGYQEEFLKLFGFGNPAIDYTKEVELEADLVGN